MPALECPADLLGKAIEGVLEETRFREVDAGSVELVSREVPPWVKLVVDPKLPADRHAEYVFDRNVKPEMRFNQGLLDDVVVRVRPVVLQSDEAIVGVLRHELYELENLVRKLATSMTKHAQLLGRRDAMLARFELQNHGESE